MVYKTDIHVLRSIQHFWQWFQRVEPDVRRDSREGPVWAGRVGVVGPLVRECYDRSNGGSEPVVTDASNCANSSFAKLYVRMGWIMLSS
ncbi:hypothetical protein C8N36_107157 [Pelagimonas varians]|nr:hypothetical protein C8N36_107157 [Pelagimonas varians]